MTQSWLGENVTAVHAMVPYEPKGFDMHYLKKNKKNESSASNLNLKRMRFQVKFRFSKCCFYKETDSRLPRQ